MKVKICGVTTPEDAAHSAGADYIGVIFSDLSKRKVSVPVAKKIVQKATEMGAESVGVFVEETVEEIICICQETGIKIIELHGTQSKEAVYDLMDRYSIFYATSINQMATIPSSVIPLFDHSRGTGKTLDWKAFSPPKNRPWFLAGGLNPDNVQEASRLLKPTGVSVSSGVEVFQSVKKDPLLVKKFIKMAKEIS